MWVISILFAILCHLYAYKQNCIPHVNVLLCSNILRHLMFSWLQMVYLKKTGLVLSVEKAPL